MQSRVTQEREARRIKMARGRALVLLLFAIGSFGLLAGNWANATFSFWSDSVPLDLKEAQLDRQGVYRLQLSEPIDRAGISPPHIRLLDTDQEKFFYTPRAESLYTVGRGLFTVLKKSCLLFTKPRLLVAAFCFLFRALLLLSLT